MEKIIIQRSFMFSLGILLWLALRISYFIKKKENIKSIKSIKRELLINIFAVYIISLVAGVFFPITLQFGEEVIRNNPKIVLKPFSGLYKFWIYGGAKAAIKDVATNILMFIPLTFLLRSLWGNRIDNIYKATLISFFTSLSIEVLQALETLLIAGTKRTTDINDLIFNTISGALGFIIYEIIVNRPLIRYQGSLRFNKNFNFRVVISVMIIAFLSVSIPYGMIRYASNDEYNRYIQIGVAKTKVNDYESALSLFEKATIVKKSDNVLATNLIKLINMYKEIEQAYKEKQWEKVIELSYIISSEDGYSLLEKNVEEIKSKAETKIYVNGKLEDFNKELVLLIKNKDFEKIFKIIDELKQNELDSDQIEIINTLENKAIQAQYVYDEEIKKAKEEEKRKKIELIEPKALAKINDLYIIKEESGQIFAIDVSTDSTLELFNIQQIVGVDEETKEIFFTEYNHMGKNIELKSIRVHEETLNLHQEHFEYVVVDEAKVPTNTFIQSENNKPKTIKYENSYFNVYDENNNITDKLYYGKYSAERYVLTKH